MNNTVERAFAAALWYKQIRERNNDTFIPLFSISTAISYLWAVAARARADLRATR